MLRLEWNRCFQDLLEFQNIHERAFFLYCPTLIREKANQLMLFVKIIPVMRYQIISCV